jgi:hypothetical protein
MSARICAGSFLRLWLPELTVSLVRREVILDSREATMLE